MRATRSINRESALTLLEVVLVFFSLAIMALVLLPALSAPRVRSAIGCVNQLKHLGLSFRVWEGDHGDKYPTAVSTTNGLGVAENIFQTVSNELGNTRVLVCPADRHRLPAASFRTLTTKNLSYFYKLDASESNPQDILLGDDNLTIRGVRVKSGVLVLSNWDTISWSADRHRSHGNLALADGSVQSATRSGLHAYLGNATNAPPATNAALVRLAIP